MKVYCCQHDVVWEDKDANLAKTKRLLTDAAIRLLGDPANTRSRFFLWVHYLDPHAAYVRDPRYDFGARERDLYDSEVAGTDAHVGRLLDFMKTQDFSRRPAEGANVR